MRIESAPRWAGGDERACVVPVERGGTRAALLTVTFSGDGELPGADALEAAASQIRVLVHLQHAKPRQSRPAHASSSWTSCGACPGVGPRRVRGGPRRLGDGAGRRDRRRRRLGRRNRRILAVVGSGGRAWAGFRGRGDMGRAACRRRSCETAVGATARRRWRRASERWAASPTPRRDAAGRRARRRGRRRRLAQRRERSSGPISTLEVLAVPGPLIHGARPRGPRRTPRGVTTAHRNRTEEPSMRGWMP